METQNARSARRSTLRPSQQRHKAARQTANSAIKPPDTFKRVWSNLQQDRLARSELAQQFGLCPSPGQALKPVSRVHNYALKIPWTQAGARPGHVPQCGSTAPGAVYLYHFLSFRTLLSGSPFRQSDCWTHYGKEIPRRQEARTYKGIPRWSLITIEITVLNTHTQLALG